MSFSVVRLTRPLWLWVPFVSFTFSMFSFCMVAQRQLFLGLMSKTNKQKIIEYPPANRTDAVIVVEKTTCDDGCEFCLFGWIVPLKSANTDASVVQQ